MLFLPRLGAIPTLTSRGQAGIHTFYKISCFTKIHYIYQTTVINQTKRRGDSEGTMRTEGLLKHSGYRASGNCRAGEVTHASQAQEPNFLFSKPMLAAVTYL